MRNFVDIKIVDAKAVRELRHRVLWPHLPTPEDCVIEPDELKTTIHVAAILEDKVVGVSTLIIDHNDNFKAMKQYRLRAMATAPEVRGFGIGAKIIDKAIELLSQNNTELLWCDARLIATGFYEKQNFKIKGKVYEVPKIGPHKLMYKRL